MVATLDQPRLQRRVALASLLPVLVLAAGCGTREDADAASPSAPTEAVTSASEAATTPDCSAVWVVGERLPEDYGGCQDGGVAAEDETVPCSMGDTLVRHGDGLYATPGRPIRLAEGGFAADAAYQRIYTTCTG